MDEGGDTTPIDEEITDPTDETDPEPEAEDDSSEDDTSADISAETCNADGLYYNTVLGECETYISCAEGTETLDQA